MAVAGVGIWIAFTSGSTLRLFHTETLKHLQDVNIDAPVHSMLPGTPPGREGSSVTVPSTACRQVPQKEGERAADVQGTVGTAAANAHAAVWTMALGCSLVPCGAQPLCVVPGLA